MKVGPVSGIYVDQLSYTLGEIRTSVTESEQAGRLGSSAADLADVGFAWHYVCKPGTTACNLAHDAVAQMADQAGEAGGADAIVYATAMPINGNIGDLAAWRSSRGVTHLMKFPASQLQADYCLDRAADFGLKQQGCTGMLGALRLAGALLAAEAEWRRIPCATADRFPDGAIYEQACNLVSDAAAACVVSCGPGAFRIVTAHQIINGGLCRAAGDERVGTCFSDIHSGPGSASPISRGSSRRTRAAAPGRSWPASSVSPMSKSGSGHWVRSATRSLPTTSSTWRPWPGQAG